MVVDQHCCRLGTQAVSGTCCWSGTMSDDNLSDNDGGGAFGDSDNDGVGSDGGMFGADDGEVGSGGGADTGRGGEDDAAAPAAATHDDKDRYAMLSASESEGEEDDGLGLGDGAGDGYAAGEEDGVLAYADTPNSLKKLRACLNCHLIKTQQQVGCFLG